MRWLNRIVLTAPPMTRRRVALAFTVAVVTDALQLILGPFGWVGADEILDVAAAVMTARLLGFHPLLLPTFVAELLPIVDMLPTWTACVALVVAIRRRQASVGRAPGEADENATVIDV